MNLPRSRKLWLFPACVVVLTFFYPPYSTLKGPFGAAAFRGYAWLWEVPGIDNGVVAWPLLLAQWAGIALVSGLVWLAFKK